MRSRHKFEFATLLTVLFFSAGLAFGQSTNAGWTTLGSMPAPTWDGKTLRSLNVRGAWLHVSYTDVQPICVMPRMRNPISIMYEITSCDFFLNTLGILPSPVGRLRRERIERYEHLHGGRSDSHAVAVGKDAAIGQSHDIRNQFDLVPRNEQPTTI